MTNAGGEAARTWKIYARAKAALGVLVVSLCSPTVIALNFSSSAKCPLQTNHVLTHPSSRIHFPPPFTFLFPYLPFLSAHVAARISRGEASSYLQIVEIKIRAKTRAVSSYLLPLKIVHDNSNTHDLLAIYWRTIIYLICQNCRRYIFFLCCPMETTVARVENLRNRVIVPQERTNERRMHPLPSGWEAYVSCSVARERIVPSREIRGNSSSWLRKSSEEQVYFYAAASFGMAPVSEFSFAAFTRLIFETSSWSTLRDNPVRIITLCESKIARVSSVLRLTLSLAPSFLRAQRNIINDDRLRSIEGSSSLYFASGKLIMQND